MNHLQKIRDLATEPIKSAEDRFVAVRDYCRDDVMATWRRELRDPQLQPTINDKVLRVTTLAENILGFLLSCEQVPRSKWSDLCPMFLAAIVAFIDSPLESFSWPNKIPEVDIAARAASNRRDELTKEGYWSTAEIWSWGEQGH